MACKLRLNVVCASRDKQFLVIAEDDWPLEDVKACIEIVFQKLYPGEHDLKISGLQNEFHFDLPLDYAVGDALVDAGLVFAIEDDAPIVSRNIDTGVPTCSQQNISKGKQAVKQRKNLKIARKRFLTKNKKKKGLICTSSDKVTSTTESSLQSLKDGACNLQPQVVEKILSEDTEVDIETVDDEQFLPVCKILHQCDHQGDLLS